CSLGRLLSASGAYDKALEPLATAVARNSSHGEARFALGYATLALGQTQDAVKQAQAWQFEDPVSAAGERDRAFALYLSGQWKDADAAAAHAVKLDPKNADGHRIRAQVLFARGDGRGGFSELEDANRLNPKDAETFCAIGSAFLRQGAKDNAAKAFEAAAR